MMRVTRCLTVRMARRTKEFKISASVPMENTWSTLQKRMLIGDLVVDGVEGPNYSAILLNGPSFHADGTLEFLAIKEGKLYRVKQRL